MSAYQLALPIHNGLLERTYFSLVHSLVDQIRLMSNRSRFLVLTVIPVISSLQVELVPPLACYSLRLVAKPLQVSSRRPHKRHLKFTT